MDIIKDKLQLKYSENFNVQGIEEADVNLVLDSTTNGMGTVTGIVTCDGVPVIGATVKIFDKNDKPFAHDITDENGRYTINNVPEGTYNTVAAKEGYLINDAINFVVIDAEIKTINIEIKLNVYVNLNAIAGLVYFKHTTALGGVMVTLEDKATSTTVAETTSANDGEFLFYDVVDGEYVLYCALAGYQQESTLDVTVKNGQIVNVQLNMIENAVKNVGTISGIISDKYGKTVNNAVVGLYAIDKETNSEKLIALTRTNEAGKYLFGDIVAGEYVVKAKSTNSSATSSFAQSTVTDSTTTYTTTTTKRED